MEYKINPAPEKDKFNLAIANLFQGRGNKNPAMDILSIAGASRAKLGCSRRLAGEELLLRLNPSGGGCGLGLHRSRRIGDPGVAVPA
ncbi:MAG: hypothetical protein HYV66_01360, partial [Candidatus Sungbacteria bacterium]|nr:hypothetical protein [Candidatus Sungbacteria bacterium]